MGKEPQKPRIDDPAPDPHNPNPIEPPDGPAPMPDEPNIPPQPVPPSIDGDEKHG